VAVLPFKNLSTDASQDFFSGEITEDVITALGRFSNLLVVAKSASFQLKIAGRTETYRPPKSGACSTFAISLWAAFAALPIAFASTSS
jgi:hypothetical protein